MTQETSPLAVLGVDGFDELVYRHLLTLPEATPADLATSLGQRPDRVDRALNRLREYGLANRLSGRTRRYTATESEAAIGALVRAHTGELDRVRTTAAELNALFHAARERAGTGDAVEIVSGREAVGRWFVRLQQQVKTEMLALDRPPYALAAPNPLEPVSLASGVEWRAIYAPEALAIPGMLEEVRAHVARGEQARVLANMPLKLAVADHRIALLPLTLDLSRMQAAVVHESVLLDALVDLFESYWQRAVPLDHRGEAGPGDRPDRLTDEDRDLLTLLVSGLKDDAIARQLGLSTRTMRRRMRRLLDLLGAENRFQAGVQAARRNWI
jgi:DNA-binding CsgD family transcriptional regulator/DNA-binding MarR family transcriptional regulator